MSILLGAMAVLVLFLVASECRRWFKSDMLAAVNQVASEKEEKKQQEWKEAFQAILQSLAAMPALENLFSGGRFQRAYPIHGEERTPFAPQRPEEGEWDEWVDELFQRLRLAYMADIPASGLSHEIREDLVALLDDADALKDILEAARNERNDRGERAFYQWLLPCLSQALGQTEREHTDKLEFVSYFLRELEDVSREAGPTPPLSNGTAQTFTVADTFGPTPQPAPHPSEDELERGTPAIRKILHGLVEQFNLGFEGGEAWEMLPDEHKALLREKGGSRMSGMLITESSIAPWVFGVFLEDRGKEWLVKLADAAKAEAEPSPSDSASEAKPD